jgi:lysophospholipase L1-like esterase
LFSKKFSLGTVQTDDAILVSAQDLYIKNKGYGMIPYDTPFGSATERLMESGAWSPEEELFKTARIPEFAGNEFGVEICSAGWPLRFRAAVPEEGTYKVTVTIKGGNEGLQKLNVYTGRRNLARRDIDIAPGGEFSITFMVHIGDYIPEMGQPPKADLSVHIAITGDKARLSSVTIEKAEAATLFIAGDSIVADYDARFPYNPLISGGAWGQYVLQYLDGMAVNNQAHGGMTTNCFRADGHLDIILKRIRPGDVFLFQFGHNDQKRRNLAAFTGYTANLRWYVKKIRSMGAVPIIVTSLSRMPGRDEYGFYDLLEDHAEACRRVGRELKAPVIDLHRHSFEVFCSMESGQMKSYFNDMSHTNDYGAMLMAEFIAKEIKRQKIEPLCGYLNECYPAPWIPDEGLRPVRSDNPLKKEEKPILPIDMIALPYADCKHIRQLPLLKEAMAKGLLDPCLKFFHPFAEMPRGQFFFLFFKAVKAPEKRMYQGKYCDLGRYEWDASFVQAALDMELIDPATTPDDRFRPDEGLTGGELLSIIVRSLHEPDDRNFNMAECVQQAKSLGLIWEGYGRDIKVNRADCTAALVHRINVTEEEKRGLPHVMALRTIAAQ